MRSPLVHTRVLVVLVLVAFLASTTVARAQDDPPPEQPTAAPQPTSPPAPTAVPAPEPTPPADPSDGTEPAGDDDEAPDGDEEEEEDLTREPRCAATHVDLTPEADNPTCMSQLELARLLGDFEAAAADEAASLAELTDALARLDEYESQLEAATASLADVRLRQSEAEGASRFAQIRTSTAEEGLQDVQAALAIQEEQLTQQAIDAYIGGDNLELAVATSLLELDSVSEVETAREYASVVITDKVATVDAVTALRDAAATMEDIVSTLAVRAEADADLVLVIEAEAATAHTRQEQLVADAEAEASSLAETLADIQRRKAAFAEELHMSGAGGGSIGTLLADLQADQEPPPVLARLLAVPLGTTKIGSGFGPRVHPIFSDTRLHTGMDMSSPAGANIYAAADGVVVMAEEVGGYGNLVVIDHGNTIATLYAHMTADAVAVGDVLAQGDLVGFVGSTGYSTGPHLHFEVRVIGQPVDPIPYLDLAS